MNPSLNANSSNNSYPSSGTAGTGKNSGANIGNKVRGAAEFIHGLGENARGTVLGAVDTMVHGGTTANDDIATKGRLEMDRGLGNVRSGTTTGPQGFTSTPGATGHKYGLSTGNNTTGLTGNNTYGTSINNPTSNPQYPLGEGAAPNNWEATAGETGGSATQAGRAGYGSHDVHANYAHHREDARASIPADELPTA